MKRIVSLFKWIKKSCSPPLKADHCSRFVTEAAEFLAVKEYQQRNLNSSHDSTSSPSPCAFSYCSWQCDRLQRIR
ncbi:hypothetical protein TNCT_409871 [Trichonephila clavata]|uniref:Uncharacterized protein n=1 Tax=Trichonephila clavata TaxID=2740835 RepID=A0A8X6LGM1_TRICU|nr:hypothetical protein TNCT_409871 [Trichonephila clavata]